MTPNSLRVIEVIADSSLSGGPRHIVDLLTGFKAKYPEFELHVICPDGWLVTAAKDLATVHVVPMAGNALNKNLQKNLQEKLAELTSSETTPSLVHFHGVRAGISGAPAVKKLGLIAIYTEHRWTADYHLANPLREWLQLRYLRGANQTMRGTIAVSQAVADFLKAKKVAAPDHIHLVPNGVPIPEKFKAASDFSSGPSYTIGWIGSLIPVKGLAMLIEALPLIRQNLPKIRLEVIGAGSDEQSLKHLAKRFGVSSAIDFLGNVDDIQPLFLRWDLFVSTSITESFGMAIAEAMAAGLPVVATESAATKELVGPANGRLVDASDHHDLAKAIIDLLPQTQKRAELGAAGRTKIIGNFSQAQMVQKTAELYKSVLSVS